MPDTDTKTDAAGTSPRLQIPSLLNILTILTLVGCSIGILSSFWAYRSAKERYDDALGLQIPEGQFNIYPRKALGRYAEMERRSYENRIAILLVSLTGIAFCAYGAFQMRRLKKRGFYLWMTGESLPILGTLFLVGGGAMGGVSIFLLLLIPAIFFFLYSSQRIYLVN